MTAVTATQQSRRAFSNITAGNIGYLEGTGSSQSSLPRKALIFCCVVVAAAVATYQIPNFLVGVWTPLT